MGGGGQFDFPGTLYPISYAAVVKGNDLPLPVTEPRSIVLVISCTTLFLHYCVTDRPVRLVATHDLRNRVDSSCVWRSTNDSPSVFECCRLDETLCRGFRYCSSCMGATHDNKIMHHAHFALNPVLPRKRQHSTRRGRF